MPASSPIEVLITVPVSEELLVQLRGISTRLNITASQIGGLNEISPETWARIEVLYTAHLLPQPEQVPALRWIQFHFAGIDRFLDEPLLKKENLLITTLSGASASQVAEHVLTMMLALSRKVPALLTAQKKAEWPKDRLERFIPFELRGKTAGIVGYGSIGRQVARLLQPFGVTVLACKRDLMHPADNGYLLAEGMGDPNAELVTRLYPAQALRSMARECHFLIVTVPLTPKTNNLIDERILNSLPPGAFLVDVSRGGVVNHTALLKALQTGRLGGAALDVFPEEPLPASSPLWALPNVILSPHISGNSSQYTERAMRLFAENLLRYVSGLPLYNLVDRQRGY
ncbi:MAG: D-2-hydroxyacid dehydrogenase [Anaerolineae bacterium]|nr:MAG: D-2-hydroxyacid dehydrogenase [Anaerolineae bacterium]